jgi:hypothetical protein
MKLGFLHLREENKKTIDAAQEAGGEWRKPDNDKVNNFSRH